jgi:hypothetical protein
LFVHFFLGKGAFDAVSRSPELLFFSLMVSASALGDLAELRELSVKDITIPIIRSSLYVAVIMSAILYGAFLHATITGTVDDSFALRAFWVSVVLALLSASISTAGQVFLSRILKE